MKTDVYLSINIGCDSTYITVEDSSSGAIFLETKITPEKLSKLLSGQGNVKCEATIEDLDIIGKKHENERFDFEISEELYNKGNNATKELVEIANNMLTDGWKIDSWFKSQDSFFKQDGKYYASSVIRRWI